MKWLDGFLGVRRCGKCGRALRPNARKCRGCHAVTGVPWNPGGEQLDRWVDGLRLAGIATGVAVVFGGILLLIPGDGAGGILVAYGVLVVASHALLPFLPLGWHLAEGLWGIGVLGAWVWLRSDAAVAALAAFPPLAMWGLMLWLRPRLLPHLEGRLPEVDGLPPARRFTPGPCEVCGRRDAEIVAAVFVLSVLFMTARRTLGPRNLCVTHARIAAMPATVLTLAFGWWGVPWGLLWTPGAVYTNLTRGGVRLTRAEADEHLADLQRSALGTKLFVVLGLVAAVFLGGALLLARW